MWWQKCHARGHKFQVDYGINGICSTTYTSNNHDAVEVNLLGYLRYKSPLYQPNYVCHEAHPPKYYLLQHNSPCSTNLSWWFIGITIWQALMIQSQHWLLTLLPCNREVLSAGYQKMFETKVLPHGSHHYPLDEHGLTKEPSMMFKVSVEHLPIHCVCGVNSVEAVLMVVSPFNEIRHMTKPHSMWC